MDRGVTRGSLPQAVLLQSPLPTLGTLAQPHRGDAGVEAERSHSGMRACWDSTHLPKAGMGVADHPRTPRLP